MTQELIDLRTSILEGRYQDALEIVDEIESMSKQDVLRKIESFLVRLLVHLIKNQVEQRLTNSWVASISDSLVQIKKLNLKDNKTSYYIKVDEWQSYLEEAIELSIRPASAEIMQGRFNSYQLSEVVDRDKILTIAKNLLVLTYAYAAKDLVTMIDDRLAELPGGEDWREGKTNWKQ
jgi:hypothetical protein